MAKFNRVAKGSVVRDADDTANIRIYIARTDAATKGKGNITRTIVVGDTKVSTVHKALEGFLFGEK